MVEIDFTNYTSFSSCPAWWRSFVNVVCEGLSSINVEPRNRALEESLKIYNAKIIDSDNDDIECLVFEEEIDFLAFKLKYGS